MKRKAEVLLPKNEKLIGYKLNNYAKELLLINKNNPSRVLKIFKLKNLSIYSEILKKK